MRSELSTNYDIPPFVELSHPALQVLTKKTWRHHRLPHEYPTLTIAFLGPATFTELRLFHLDNSIFMMA
jgi:hypothetical protein